MSYIYRPHGAPTRQMRTAPPAVRDAVLDIIEYGGDLILSYDVLLRPQAGGEEFVGFDLGTYGVRGQHFFLNPLEAKAYRRRMRSARVPWHKLPEKAQKAIEGYLAIDAWM